MAEVISPDVNARIDYRILMLILVGLIGLQFFLNGLENEKDIESAVTIVSISTPLAVSISALIISKRYWESKILGKGYLALSFAFLFVVLGEISYILLEFVFNVDPYPSFADVLFFLLYPLSMMHLIINIKFFAGKISRSGKFIIIVLASVLILSYSYFAFVEVEELNFDFAYGIIFVGGSSIVLSTSIFGTKVTSKIPLGKAWQLLMIGIAFGMIADFWYNLLEISGSYTVVHVVNLMWYGSYCVIVYSLYKHSKII